MTAGLSFEIAETCSFLGRTSVAYTYRVAKNRKSDARFFAGQCFRLSETRA